MRGSHHGWQGRRDESEGGREGRGGGRRRMFDGGELRLVLLLLMETQPRYGYDLIREIEARTGGAYVPSPGIIYPTLTMLEELEHIASADPGAKAEGAKRAFVLTGPGKAFLDERRPEAEAIMDRLETIRSASAQTEAGPVWRAMQNLKAVLAARPAGNADKEAIFKVAELIDEAARQIERLP